MTKSLALLLALLALTAGCSAATATVAPTPVTPSATSAAVEADVCGSLPLDLAGWRERLSLAAADDDELSCLHALFGQGQALSSELRRWTWSDLEAALSVDDSAPAPDLLRRHLAVAYLNLAEGRLHRASLPAEGEAAQTVGSLLQAAEEQLAAGTVDTALLAAVESVGQGQGLQRRACSQIAQLRGSDSIVSLVRWEDRVAETSLLTEPLSDTFPWLMSQLHPSPDYRVLAVTTYSFEAGGPVLLLDVSTGEWANANREYDLAMSESGAAHSQDETATWQVIGWHPNSTQLLLAVEGQSLAFWLDLDAGTYERIVLSDDGGCLGGERHMALAPDGSGFVYVAGDGQRLDRYDFATGTRTTIWQQPQGGGRINYPQFDPDGDRLAFVTEPGRAGSHRACSLEVIGVSDGSHQVLVDEGASLGRPRWSAQGQGLTLQQGSGETARAWTLDAAGGQYRVSSTDASAAECRIPTFAQAQVEATPSVTGDGADAWLAAVNDAVSGSDTAYFIP